MTLLLGPPISGKTTLLLALAAKLDPKLKVRTLRRRNSFFMNNIFMFLLYVSIFDL